MSNHSRTAYFYGLIILIVVVVSICCLWSLKKTKSLISPGPLTTVHSNLEHNCQSCHSKPFQKVSDDSCLSCHKVSDHSNLHPVNDLNCTSCHGEHNGEKNRTPLESNLCLKCHENLQSVNPKATIKAIRSFYDHPEINNPNRIEDLGTVRLNHALHLKKDLNTINGVTTMQCSDCHNVADDFKRMQPPSFNNNCRSCHPLTFDERLPDVKVPHGDTDAVFQFLISEYAKLGGRNLKVSAPERSLPGGEDPVVAQKEEFVSIIKNARAFEEVLFSKTGCQLCHNLKEKESYTDNESRYTIPKAEVKEAWFPHARFSHGAHQTGKCIDCHSSAEKSEKTDDINMPKLKDCQNCHTQSGKDSTVKSECSMCHAYHSSLIKN